MHGKSNLSSNKDSKSFFNLRNNSSADCMIVERPQSHASRTKGSCVSSFLEVEGERAYGNNFSTKRVHMENNSPRVGYVRSPSSKEEPDVCGNGFVTARAKLVWLIFLLRLLSLFSPYQWVWQIGIGFFVSCLTIITFHFVLSGAYIAFISAAAMSFLTF